MSCRIIRNSEAKARPLIRKTRQEPATAGVNRLTAPQKTARAAPATKKRQRAALLADAPQAVAGRYPDQRQHAHARHLLRVGRALVGRQPQQHQHAGPERRAQAEARVLAQPGHQGVEGQVGKGGQGHVLAHARPGVQQRRRWPSPGPSGAPSPPRSAPPAGSAAAPARRARRRWPPRPRRAHRRSVNAGNRPKITSSSASASTACPARACQTDSPRPQASACASATASRQRPAPSGASPLAGPSATAAAVAERPTRADDEREGVPRAVPLHLGGHQHRHGGHGRRAEEHLGDVRRPRRPRRR